MTLSKVILLICSCVSTIIVPAQISGHSSNYGNTPDERDGNNILNLTYSLTKCGLNYTQSSFYVTDRLTTDPGNGLPALLSITNIPACANIEQAYLYWISSNSYSDPAFTINGNPQNATLIGQGPDKCWSMGATFSYRADVTSFVSGNGNFTVDINAGTTSTDGVTLLVIYSDPTMPFEGTIILHDGNVVNVQGTSNEYMLTGFSACASGINSSAFMLSSDFQNNISPYVHVLEAGDNSSTFNNDFYNFDIVYPTIEPGEDSLLFEISCFNGDCYAFTLAGLYFQSIGCLSCSQATLPVTVTVSQTADTCESCNGTAVATVSGGSGNYNYNWFPPPVSGQGTNSVVGLCYGNYALLISDSTCAGHSTNLLIDSAGTVPNASITSSDLICTTDTVVQLTAVDPGGTWSGAGIINNSTGMFDASLNGTGGYEIIYSIVNSLCSSSDTMYLMVNEEPVSGFTYTINGGNVNFNNTSFNSVNYDWDFGDGNISTSTNPSHTFSSNGLYVVCLTSEMNLCEDTYCDTIQIIELGIDEFINGSVFLFPNPAYDHLNLVLNLNETTNFSIEMVNILGEKVYHEDKKAFIKGTQYMRYEISRLAAGIYFIKLYSDNSVKTLKFIIE